MKKILITLLALIAVGGFTMTDFETFKKNMIKIAQDEDGHMKQSTFKSVIDKAVQDYGQAQVIQFAVDYSKDSNYKDAVTLVDDELRAIARNGNRYFQPFDVKKERQEFRDLVEKNNSGFLDSIPWWAKIAGVGLIGFGVFMFIKRRKK